MKFGFFLTTLCALASASPVDKRSRIVGIEINAKSTVDSGSKGLAYTSKGKPAGDLFAKFGASSLSLLAAMKLPTGPALFIGLLLVGGANILFPPRKVSSWESFSAIQGFISELINEKTNDKDLQTSKLELQSKNESLSLALNQYLAYVTGNVDFQGKVEGNFTDLDPKQVDVLLNGVDSAIGQWLPSLAVDTAAPYAFHLLNTKNPDEIKCLHTKDGKTLDGAELVFDSNCNLDSQDDKTFGIQDDKLVFRLRDETMCVTFSEDDGKDIGSSLAIKKMDSKSCKEGAVVTLGKSGTPALTVNGKVSCAQKKDNLVKVPYVDEESFAAFEKGSLPDPGIENDCSDNSIEFDMKLTLPLASLPPPTKDEATKIQEQGVDGLVASCMNNDAITDKSICNMRRRKRSPKEEDDGKEKVEFASFESPSSTKPMSWAQIGLYLSWAEQFVSYQLLSIKEQYLHGDQDENVLASKEQKFKDTTANYVKSLSSVIPVYESYAKITKAPDHINNMVSDLKEFVSHLKDATIKTPDDVYLPKEFI